MDDFAGLTTAQQLLIDQCNHKLNSGNRLGIQSAQQVVKEILNPLVALDRKFPDDLKPIFSLPKENLFNITRVLMQACMESSADDVLRSGPGLLASLYRSTAANYKFNAESPTHAEEMKILHRIEYESLTMARPNDTLKAAARIIAGREPTAVTMRNFENAGITLSSVGPVAVQNIAANKTAAIATPAVGKSNIILPPPPPVKLKQFSPPLSSPSRLNTPPAIPVRSATPPPIPIHLSKPPSITVKAATPPPLPVRSVTPPPVPVKSATPPPIPVRSATPPPLPTKSVTPPPVTSRPTTPPPLPERPSTPPARPRRPSAEQLQQHSLFTSKAPNTIGKEKEISKSVEEAYMLAKQNAGQRRR